MNNKRKTKTEKFWRAAMLRTLIMQ